MAQGSPKEPLLDATMQIVLSVERIRSDVHYLLLSKNESDVKLIHVAD